MFESLTLTTILLMLFFTYQNMRWGLNSDIPKDANARLRFYCSECLTILKSLLAGARIEQLEADSLSFNDGQVLRVTEGNVTLQQPAGKDRKLCILGPLGHLHFERLSEKGLLVTIQAQEDGEPYRASLRLEAQFEVDGPDSA